MSYGLYIGKNHTASKHAWLAGYGDEPSSHWLEIIPRMKHKSGSTVTVGVTERADMPGARREIPQVAETARQLRVSYSQYKGVPAPITNGGLNEFGVAVRDIWSTSRQELCDMTPVTQSGPNYSDQARLVIDRARSARDGVMLIATLIATYGECSYGGNSHLIADADEAWVMIQFAGGKGLWVAERLGADSIRASRPGYIGVVPVHDTQSTDYLYSDNFLSYAIEQGWYVDGEFNANDVYGDGKGRWQGVQWIENEMHERAVRAGKITLQDMIWALRTSRLTGDTAGYGQVVPLTGPGHSSLRMLWHAPIGAVAAPFAPVFLGQHCVPLEFQQHRYLTEGESARFMDNRKVEMDDVSSVSVVSQQVESSRSAVAECKRLLYLMLQDKNRYTAEVTGAFEGREASLIETTERMVATAAVLFAQGEDRLAEGLLEYFSQTELTAGLDLVVALSNSIEARLKIFGAVDGGSVPAKYDQLW